MLDSTIVLMTGEFGRTPEVNANGGRAHWPGCFTVTIGGGSIAGERVIAASDKDGMLIKETPVQVPDFMASIYPRLGIDYTKENLSNIGRPLRIVPGGKPLAFFVAPRRRPARCDYTTPRKYRKLAPMLSFGATGLTPNLMSCSTTHQPL